jgi:serine phosphatase RsbU (regulator of sigma subunit)
MYEAARRFARRVLIIHVLLLAAVVGLVVLAAREVYSRTRAEALSQAQERQELLASQTARGVESHYRSIIDNLDLLRAAPEEDPGSRPLGPRGVQFAPVFWAQLEGRISHLFVIDTATMSVDLFGEMELGTTGAIVSEAEQWLRSVQEPAISAFMDLSRGGGGNLIAVPVTEGGRRLLVAVVPVRPLEQRFLDPVNREERMSATLLDESLSAMATSDQAVLGPNVAHVNHPILRELTDEYIAAGRRRTVVIEEPVEVQQTMVPPRMISTEPVHVLGKKWAVVISSDLSEVDRAVANIFGRSLLWAVFVIVSMMAILISTAVQLIRGRLRLERVQREMLEREVSQARRIQLAWLPDESDAPHGIDIAAVNHPASHISGDFYNWFELEDGRTAVVIGDVTGHGMGAAFLMATTQLLVRTSLERVRDPGRALEDVNRQLCSQVFNGQFVTLLVLVVDTVKGKIDLASAGHFPPLVGQGESFESFDIEPQLVLGIEPNVRYRSWRFDIAPDACLLLYTDGVLDVQAPDGRRFDIESLHQALYGRCGSAQSLLDTVTTAVNEFRDGREPADDLTIVAVQLQGSPAKQPPPQPVGV